MPDGPALAGLLEQQGLRPGTVVVERNGTALVRSELAASTWPTATGSSRPGGRRWLTPAPAPRAAAAGRRPAVPVHRRPRAPGRPRASSSTRCWPAASTSCSCARRAWRRARSSAPLEVLADACRRHGALLAVNDRADVAHAAGADVLHLGQDDLPVPAARRILGAGVLVGRSTHDRAAGRRGRRRAGRRLLLHRAVLAHPDQAGPPGARPRPGPRAPPRSAPRPPVVRDRRHRRGQPRRGARRPGPPGRGGPGDHRGRRPARPRPARRCAPRLRCAADEPVRLRRRCCACLLGTLPLEMCCAPASTPAGAVGRHPAAGRRRVPAWDLWAFRAGHWSYARRHRVLGAGSACRSRRCCSSWSIPTARSSPWRRSRRSGAGRSATSREPRDGR